MLFNTMLNIRRYSDKGTLHACRETKRQATRLTALLDQLRRRILASIALMAWFFPTLILAQQNLFDPEDPLASFEAMAEYLARDGGLWLADNPGYDGTQSSPASFGLQFERDVSGLFLELQIVVNFVDRAVVSSRGHWAWHPARNVLTHVMIDRGGGLTEATATFPDASRFVTVGTRFSRGDTTEHRDDNLIVGPDLHRNETFSRAGDEWKSGGIYEWRRVRTDR
ncbi:MAG: hypothetical protein HKN85_12655 [Gammaproteobacteria bacterium]|nr:hypothetical protein [Gammaproteobacteria bacterium]